VSVARFVADQRTMHRVPHTLTCAILGISISWFHKWIRREPTDRQRRRVALDTRVRGLFEASGRTYGSPRIHADLVEAGETVSVNTVADSMRRQGLQGRKPKRRRGLTRQDRSAPKFPDLLHRDFNAAAPNVKWCGDFKCRRRHLKSYADLRNMPMTSVMVCSCKAFGAVWSA
jgi:transposase InsO family protein